MTNLIRLRALPVKVGRPLYKAYTSEQVRLTQSNFTPVYKHAPRYNIPYTVACQLAETASKSVSRGAGTKIDARPIELTTGVNEVSQSEDELTDNGVSDLTESSHLDELTNQLSQIYSDSNVSSSPLATTCNGCGSNLHCHSPGVPGFISQTQYNQLRSDYVDEPMKNGHMKAMPPVLCSRCLVFREHTPTVETSLEQESFESKVISQIRNDDNSAVIVVADMTNLPHSLIPDLGDKLDSKRFVVVGNKVDQLPLDAKGCLDRWKSALLSAVQQRCAIAEERILHTMLISSLTGYGLTNLVDFLQSHRFHSNSSLYLVGSTNTGKSSLFNRLLQSDLCKSEAREAVHRATISKWPGTTAGLLKYPMALMNPAKRALRDEARYELANTFPRDGTTVFVANTGFRYLRAQPMILSDVRTHTNLGGAIEKARNHNPNLLTMPTYTRKTSESRGQEDGGSSIESSEMNMARMREVHLSNDVAVDTSHWDGDPQYRLLTTRVDPRHFNEQAWCYDTPGFVCQDQTLNYLSNADWNKYTELHTFGMLDRSNFDAGLGQSGQVIVPRTFIMAPGLSLLLGHLGRLDVLKTRGPVYFTTFSRLPVHIVESEKVEQYSQEHVSKLGPPWNSVDPPAQESSGLCGQLPPLVSHDLEPIKPSWEMEECALDVILSGAGWIGVSGLRVGSSKFTKDSGSEVFLRAWTSGGLGISTRQPALIPEAVRKRGRRLSRMREFHALDW